MMHKARVLHIIGLLLILAASQAYAKDGIEARAYIDKSSINIGDRIKYTVEVTAPRKAQIQMPAFKNNLIGEFEIKDSGSKTSERFFGNKTIRDNYFITIYSTGKKDIPEVDIKYKLNAAGDWSSKKTGALSIDVRTLLPPELPADIKDIKGPASFFEINWILVVGVLLLLIILIAAAVFYKKIMDRKPVRLPHETALEELEAIRSQLINSGDIKEYYVGVSDCVRRYIERAFALKAPEMTSEEFFSSMRDSSTLTILHKELLEGFMSACDMVKFAKYTPTGEEAENVYATAKNFINETKEVQ
jgi:hypothetical protein